MRDILQLCCFLFLRQWNFNYLVLQLITISLRSEAKILISIPVPRKLTQNKCGQSLNAIAANVSFLQIKIVEEAIAAVQELFLI